MKKNNILLLALTCLTNLTLITKPKTKVKSGNFQAYLLNREQAESELPKIRTFLNTQSKEYTSTYSTFHTFANSMPTKTNQEGMICVCKDKITNAICGTIFFYPCIKEKQFNDDDINCIILTPNLVDLVIDKTYDKHPKTKQKILSEMIELIQNFCKQRSVKELFVFISVNDTEKQNLYLSSGFNKPWSAVNLIALKPSSLYWFTKKIK